MQIVDIQLNDGQQLAGLYDEKNKSLLPIVIERHNTGGKVFTACQVADGFLSSCERSGVKLSTSMATSDIKSMFNLWFDAWKREFSPPIDANPIHKVG